MNELIIDCDKESPQKPDSKINISILNHSKQNLLFKFIIGLDGKWETLKEFGKTQNIIWEPKESGNYILMVQAKIENSNKAFDYISRKKFDIIDENEELICDAYVDKEKYNIGDKVTLTAKSKKDNVMFRYMIKENERWVLAKDYSPENTFNLSVNSPEKQEILIQCKTLDSQKSFEDARKVEFEVIDMKNLEIISFRCLNTSILVSEELVFEVDAAYCDNRTTLYKFIKLDCNGQAKCIQDYSTKKVVSYTEKNSGSYKLLCLAKDMYSPNEYDDRAILYYQVKPYEAIEIESFTSDLSSPQVITQPIIFKAVIKGGRDLRYRFIIEGSKNQDSGYVKDNSFLWKPKEPGNYKITLWVKDISYSGNYEACDTLKFIVDDILREPVKIKNVILDKNKNILIGNKINIKVIAEGGIKPLYSFIVKKDNKKIEEVNYNECNWVDFTPEEEGNFEIEIRAKDKYSDKKFDSHSIVSVCAYKYIPAKIDYILVEPKEYYFVSEQIILNVIATNTKDILLKYILLINGHKVEETDYVKNKRYILIPKCSGRYIIKVYAKNKKSDKEFDSAKEIKCVVNDAPPVSDTILKCNRSEIYCNEPMTIIAESSGGKDVIYEFYLMEKGEWNLVQKYSKKNYYTFIPFTKGIYKVLVLSKSSYKKSSYEDYCIIKIKAIERWLSEGKDFLMDIKLDEEEIKTLNFAN